MIKVSDNSGMIIGAIILGGILALGFYTDYKRGPIKTVYEITDIQLPTGLNDCRVYNVNDVKVFRCPNSNTTSVSNDKFKRTSVTITHD